MQFAINIKLPEAEFRRQIEALISNARKNQTVLPLPLHFSGSSLEVSALVLSQINCTNCDALCCRSTKYAPYGIPFLATEYNSLENNVGKDKLAKMDIKVIGKTRYLPTPCPLLRKKQCTIYDIRPFVCVNYPIDMHAIDEKGEKLLSLDSFCPEARRIAKHAYFTLWMLNNKAQEAYSQREEQKEAALEEAKLKSDKNLSLNDKQ